VTIAPGNSNTAVTYFGVRDINNRDNEPCILCQQPILPFKWRKRVERYDPDERVQGQFKGAPSKTVAEDQRRRYTHFLGWSHGYHKWVNPSLSRKWLENRIDVIDVSKEGIDKLLDEVYTIRAMTKQQEVKALREQLGWTQREVAIRLDVTVKAVSAWETGRATPQEATLIALRGFLEKAQQGSGYAA
jgi:DNA-binding transcriptional regulator YiaG